MATAAHLLGLSDRMIAMTAEYARARHQFGHPIGSFQAVKHLLAGAQVKLEFARPVVYAAAWALDEGDPSASRAASTAKAYASDAATEAARVSLQVHGAIGYTWECDLHLFLKRAWALSEAWGSASDHRHLVLDSLTGDVATANSAASEPRAWAPGAGLGRRLASGRLGLGEGVDGHPVVGGRPGRQVGTVDDHGQRSAGGRPGVAFHGDHRPVGPHLHHHDPAWSEVAVDHGPVPYSTMSPGCGTAVGGSTPVSSAAQV